MINESAEGIIIDIKVVPNSSKNDIILDGEIIKVKVTAQPVENKANKAVIEYLSKFFKLPKTSIDVIKGQTSKDKRLLLKTNLKQKKEEILNKLQQVEDKKV